MRASRRHFLVAAAVSPLVLTACGGEGENKPITYKAGTYQGAKYTPPWDNDRFKGDERSWQDNLRVRAQNQNDYSRMGDNQRGNL
jgi:major membrane immunogen (membrane-anchored lipoprotein)